MSDTTKLLQQANSHLKAGENVQAAALLEHLHVADPCNELLRGKLITAYLRASVQFTTNSVAEAERFLQKALVVDGSSDSVHLSYIKFLRREGRHQEADVRQNKFLDLVEVKPETRYLLAKIAYDSREYARSTDQLDQLLATDPDHVSAKTLLPAACYRAGRHDHPSLVGERQRQANPMRFADGLARIAKVIGVEATPDDGRLPDRRSWSEAQRYEWGRRVDSLIRDQILGGLEFRADVERYTRSFSLPPVLQEGGAVIFLLHVGSIHLALGKIIAGNIPFKHVTNSVPLGVAFPGQMFDVLAIPSTTLLSRMALALRRGACVTVAIDGPLGQRADGFVHLGVEYSIAAGPLALAHTMRARTYLLVAGYEERSMVCRLLEGPVAATSIEDLQAFWGDAIRSEVASLTESGPENYIQHASSQIKAVTINPYRPA